MFPNKTAINVKILLNIFASNSTISPQLCDDVNRINLKKVNASLLSLSLGAN